MTLPSPTPSPLAALRRFVRRPPAAERCELCGAELAAEHPHLLEPAKRQLHCACQPCAILFSSQANARFRRVVPRAQWLPDFQMTDVQWAGLRVPVNLVFLTRRTPDGQVTALYPSPGGAVESEVPADTWADLAACNPVLDELEPEVEALLVYRVGAAREYYRLSIDECFRLVGVIRTHWRGLSGGTEVWKELDRYFTRLKERGGHA